MQQRKVTFPRQADWMPVVLKEFLRFPAGMHDDTIDALAWSIFMCSGKTPPNGARAKGPKTEKTVAEKVKMALGGPKTGGFMAA
jgi:hypothetical protein